MTTTQPPVPDWHSWVLMSLDNYNSGLGIIELSSTDPPDKPYKSKYEAKKIFTQLLFEIDSKWKHLGTMQVKVLTALFRFYLGKISIETEEINLGCDTLTDTLKDIEEYIDKPECMNLSMSILNQLGFVWTARGDIEKALHYLLKAKQLYDVYKTTTDTSPISFVGMFGVAKNGNEDWSSADQAYTQTHYFLAQVYELMNESANAAFHCRETLKRQRKEEAHDKEINTWTFNCATLSMYYIQEKRFKEARHLLCCASYVNKQYEMNVAKDLKKEDEAWSKFCDAKVTVSCYWIKYAIALLNDTEKATEDCNELLPRLVEEKEVLEMEEKVPCIISNYDEAKTLFIFAQEHVTVACAHFTLNEFANDHSQIVQDRGKLYKALAQYDPDLSRQCKIHKRRIDMLEELLGNLNPRFYLCVCLQLQFELGEIYYEMMDLKMKIVIQGDYGPDVQRIKKVNTIAAKGISHFKNFLNSFKDSKGEPLSTFSDDMVRPILIAHYYLARYYTRIFENVELKKKQQFEQAKACYKYIVDYIERNPDHLQHIELEFPVVKEVLELMAPGNYSKLQIQRGIK